MKPCHPLLLLSLSLLLHLSALAAPIGSYCAKPFTDAATKSNINHVLSDLLARASVAGFATSSCGKPPTAVYGLAHCRADVSSSDCAACLSSAAKALPASCPSQADARVWFDYCFARYSTDDFVGQPDTGYAVVYVNSEDAPEPARFVKEVGALMGRVRATAVGAGNDFLGRGTRKFEPYVTIYGLAQCTPDLSQIACAQCLSAAVGAFAEYCGQSKGCQINYSSCSARYEVYPFFFPLDKAAAAAKESVAAGLKGTYTKKILYP